MLTYKSRCLYLNNGKLIDPLDLQPGDLTPATVYHCLSMINRFTGNTLRPESVAEHSYYLYEVVPLHLKRTALIHDWSEIIFNDTPSPIKREISGYEHLEEMVLKDIFELLDVPFALYWHHKEYDTRIRNDEAEYLFPLASVTPRKEKWWDPENRLGISFMELDWSQWKTILTDTHAYAFSNQEFIDAEKTFLAEHVSGVQDA